MQARSLFDQSIVAVTATPKRILQIFAGLLFPNSTIVGATPGNLNTYENLVQSVTFVGSTVLTSDVIVNVRIVRLGNQVTVSIDPFSGIKSAVNGIISTGAAAEGPIPARMRPQFGGPCGYVRAIDSGVFTGGEIIVNAAGHIFITLEGAAPFSGTSGTVIGINNSSSLTYWVA